MKSDKCIYELYLQNVHPIAQCVSMRQNVMNALKDTS